MVTPAAARAEFDAEVTYLDTATMGLPPRRSWLALQQALAGWQAGTADAVGYDKPLAEARRSYARLVGVPPSAVAVGSQVSAFAGLIAANLPVAARCSPPPATSPASSSVPADPRRFWPLPGRSDRHQHQPKEIGHFCHIV